MMKRYIAILSIISIVAIQLFPVLSVHADTIVVPDDEDGKFYIYNHIDFSSWGYDEFLTKANYDEYFTALTGDEKTKVYNVFVDDDGNTQAYFKKIIYGLMNPSLSGANNIWIGGFKINDVYIPFDECKISCCHVNLDNETINFTLTYSPTDAPVVVVGNTLYSDAPFYMRYSGCNFYGGGTLGDGNLYYQFNNFSAMSNEAYEARYDSTNQVYYWSYQGYPFNGYIYADDVVLFQGDYSTYPTLCEQIDVYNQYKQNNPFCVDRRTQKFIDKSNGIDSSTNVLGVLQGSYKHLFTGINQEKSDLFISYELNDYTKTLKDKVSLVLDYQVNIEGSYSGQSIKFSGSFSESTGNKDIYNLFNSNILQIDMDNVFSKIYSTAIDLIPDSFIPASYYGFSAVNLYHRYSALNYFDFMIDSGGFGITQTFNHEANLWEDLFSGNNSIEITAGGRNWVIPSQSTLGYIFGSSYDYYTIGNQSVLTTCNIVLTEYLTDGVNNSAVNTYMIDLLTGEVQSVGGFETPIEGTFTSYSGQNYATNPVPYNSTAGGYSTVGGNPQAYGGSSSASVGDITIYAGANTVGKVLIDVPLEEAIENTPNLKTMYDDMKEGLVYSTGESGSLIQLTRDTYTFIPEKIWGYIAICVVTCCGLAVYRNFRGR